MGSRSAAVLLALAVAGSTTVAGPIGHGGDQAEVLEAAPLADQLVGRPTKSAGFPYADRAQRAESRYGDRSPYLGGARILLRQGTSDSYTVCSAGMPVRGRDGTEYMLTAGHCAPSNRGQHTAATGYVSRGSSGPEVTVVATMGPVTASSFVRGSRTPHDDLALIRTSTSKGVWHGSSRRPTQIKRLAGFRAVKPGTMVCHGGASTGRSCSWRVERMDVTVRYGEGGGRYSYVGGLVMARRVGPAVLRDGDSGGPVYGWTSSGRAYGYGVVSGGSGADWLLFTPVARAVDRWGLRAS